MADAYDGEWQDKTPEQRKTLRSYKDALDESKDFVRPHFDKAVRMYRLFSGEIPPEIEGTFSKCMLWFAFSAVDQELPHTAKVLSDSDWFRLEAQDPSLELPSSAAQKWAEFQMSKVQKIHRTIIPTLQQQGIFGTGYRFYAHKYLKNIKTKRVHDKVMGRPTNFRDKDESGYDSIITGQPLNFFSVYPSPAGGMVNDFDNTGENVADYTIVFTYTKKSDIEAQVKKGAFDGEEARKLFEYKGREEDDPSSEYHHDILSEGTGWNSFSTPQWVRRIKQKDLELEPRFRLGWYFRHDKWSIIGEDNFVLYDGPPLIDAIPLAKFVATPHLQEWFGIGLIEPVEDLIISMIMNFNHRMDYLAGTLHPPKFVPVQLLEELGGDQSAFDPTPYNVIPYNHNTYDNIGAQVYQDRFPDISQQAFIEDDKMREFVEEILGHPNLGKGMHGQGNTGDIGATGVVSLINTGAARQMLRAINTENSGLLESVALTMKFGAKYRSENELIPIRGEGGWPWEEVPHEAITDGYGISITGTRHLNQAEEAFRKMLATAPYVLNNPAVRDQVAASRHILKSGEWPDADKMLGEGATSAAPIPLQGTPEQAGGAATEQNAMRSMMNRNTVQPGSGRSVQAGNILV